MSYYRDKKIWVTGASSGIGKALAIALANEGARLILSSRREDKLEEVRSLCESSPEVLVITLDLSDHDLIDQQINSYKTEIQDVDILINNAGISQRSLVMDTDFDVYKRFMDVNFFGTVKISLAVLQNFIKRNKGQFVVMSSIAGKFGVPKRSGYSASKMALHGFFETLRAELHDKPIGITMVVPGFTRTDMSVNALVGNGQALGKRDKAMEKGMTPQKLARAILKAVSKNRPELVVGGFKETKLAIWVWKFFPGLFRKLVARSKVT
jgi:short-subunit dehydrogenase